MTIEINEQMMRGAERYIDKQAIIGATNCLYK